MGPGRRGAPRYLHAVTTAIVTITCPSCGGRLEGIESLDRPRTIACTFCKTDLHVPRVGEQVVREVVRETHVVRETQVVRDPLAMAPLVPLVPDGYELRKKPNLKVALVAAGVGLGVLFVVVVLARQDADDTISDLERRASAREACQATCKASCKDAGRAAAPVPAGGYGDFQVDQVMRESGQALRQADVTLCELDCAQQKRCSDL